jgi:hypothetical protein
VQAKINQTKIVKKSAEKKQGKKQTSPKVREELEDASGHSPA